MIVALILIAILVGTGLVLYLHHHLTTPGGGSPQEASTGSALSPGGAQSSALSHEDAPQSSSQGAAAAQQAAPAPEAQAAEDADIDTGVCCGMHITCEKDSLLADVSPEVEYFDDEELDRFRGRDAEAYTDPEIEEFREVLLTLLPTDIAPWARSIQLRGITLPTPVREELLMIVAEARAAHSG